MTIIEVKRDLDNLTITLLAEFAAPVERVWQLWADPRKLERWWGPPTHPATFVQHELHAGGRVTYYMTSPEGDRYHGWWQITSVTPPDAITFVDGFADQDGNPVSNLPTTDVIMRLTPFDGGTQMSVKSTYGSREALETVVAMGVEEGLRQAVGQIDAILAEGD